MIPSRSQFPVGQRSSRKRSVALVMAQTCSGKSQYKEPQYLHKRGHFIVKAMLSDCL